ncbi:MAG: hypothetical protein AB1721_03275 [Patescibacteria group bacterium]
MPQKPRKNQEILDFLEAVKKQLNDANPKNFGLYMKLYKVHGKEKISRALEIALQKKEITNNFRYFLGILAEEQKRRPELKEKSVKINQEVLEKYNKLKRKLKKKLTPKYQRISRTRSRLYHQVAKEERNKRN